MSKRVKYYPPKTAPTIEELYEQLSDEEKARVHLFTYSTEDRQPLCTRVVLLGDLCADLWQALHKVLFLGGEIAKDDLDALYERMAELGVES